MSYGLKLFDVNPDNFFDEFASAFGRQPRAGHNPFPAEVREAESHYILELDVPGVAKSDLKIEFHDDILTISGERKSESAKDSKQGYYSTRSYGKFSRSFRLPAGANVEKIEAIHKDGVLRVAIPKEEEVKPREIPVKDSDTSGFFGKLFAAPKQEKAVP